jgi:signal transduction histidine kinase/ligand-binding sensor domain-containing protein/DNA-binding NarL/FixJ family response regulator
MNLKGKIFFILLIVSITCHSQSPRFKHITTNDGLSQSEVYSFLEDSRGFMWFGTVDGLNRYDGYDITIFNTDRNNPNSITNNTIRSLAEDNLGRIWIGTDDGLSIYVPKTGLVYQIKIAEFENLQLRINSILIDGNNLFLGTSRGLLQTNIESEDLKTIESGFQIIENTDSNSLTSGNINSIKKSNDESIWVVKNNSVSRIVIQPRSNKAYVIDKLLIDGVKFRTIEEDIYGNLWLLANNNGLFKYDTKNKLYEHFTADNSSRSISSNVCSSIVSDKNGNLWISTLDKGLNLLRSDQLDKRNPHFEYIQNDPLNLKSVNSNLINSLYVSKNNQLWVGTIGSGVSMFDPQQKEFNHFKIQSSISPLFSTSNFIRSVYADNEGINWVGTHNNGLFILDRTTGEFNKIGFGKQAIFFISSYKNNKVFVCSSQGISLVQLLNGQLKILGYIDTNAAFHIVEGGDKVYWIATEYGLIRARIVNHQFVIDKTYSTNTKPSISTNNCRVLFYDPMRNELLLGTEGGGLNIIELDDKQFVKNISVYKNGNSTNSLSSNYVRSILRDSKQDIWIGTYEGLNKMIRDSSSGNISFKTYTKKEGLPNNTIQLITDDEQGNLWIGTNGGLSKFDHQKNQFTNYTTSDGIQSNEFSEHTVFKKSDGEIIVGGINGINTFYPEKIQTSKLKPKTAITDFYLFNKKVSVNEMVGRKAPLTKGITLTDTIVLLPKQNNIRFDFSAMLFSNPGKIQYAHMLEGFDKEWNYTDATQRNAGYTNLGSGNYVFKVKSTNSDEIWEDSPKTIFIHIKTPFVYTWFAYLIYLSIIVLILIYFTHFSVIRYTTKNRIFLENEHNTKIHELDVLRTKFFINISHDLRTPLTLISGPLEKILKASNLKPELKYQLELINRNVKRLRYLTEQLLDIRKSEAGKLQVKLQRANIVDFAKEEAAHFDYAIQNKGLLLKVISNESIIMVNFDSDMISKMIFNLLSNAIKYTEKGEITIRIEKVIGLGIDSLTNSQSAQYIKVEVQDTGRGIGKDKLSKVFERFYQDETKLGKGYGIGLSHCKELVEAHSGIIEIDSTKKVGTIIRFFIPDTELPDQKTQNGIARESSTEDIYMDSATTPAIELNLTSNDSLQTVLVVEDNTDMRIFIKNELTEKYKVVEAKDGIEGLEKAETHSPDLIVSDIMMPNMDGIELCRQIKSKVNTSHIPVILLTAKVDDETKFRGIETGADDYISKPFSMEYLSLRIKNLLKTREHLRSLFQKNLDMEPSAVTVTSIDEQFLKKLLEIIETGIPDSKFSVATIEKELGMSHTNFYRKIKNLTGQSGKELLQNMRLKRAVQLISQKKLRVSEVAYMIGYTDPKYFTKSFKAKYGYSPSEFNEQ